MTLPQYVDAAELDALVVRCLAEDVGAGDVTSLATVAPETRAEAVFLAKGDGVLAGTFVAGRVFATVDPSVRVTWLAGDGQAIRRGEPFGRLEGPARALLTGERLALNFLQRMSGIATAARAFVDAIGPLPTRLLDTRKTAPGLRALDKWAVLLGGGTNHRVGLWDLVLIKDNHIAAAGGVARAIHAARAWRAENGRQDLAIELEVRTKSELAEALDTGGVDILLLDNMVTETPGGGVDTARLAEAVRLVGKRFRTEASGNVRLDTIEAIARTGVDFVSVGALTHSVRALDLSLDITLRTGR